MHAQPHRSVQQSRAWLIKAAANSASGSAAANNNNNGTNPNLNLNNNNKPTFDCQNSAQALVITSAKH
jgi:hypothetical protein